MAFVSIVPADRATGLLKEQYETIAKHTGAMDESNHLIEAWSLQPEVADAWMKSLRAARERPDVRILCLTPNHDTARRMTLTWGVLPVQTEDAHNFADMVQRAVRIARQQGIAQEGERLVVTAGVPFGTPGATNILRIAYV